jgi:hypothetical protein
VSETRESGAQLSLPALITNIRLELKFWPEPNTMTKCNFIFKKFLLLSYRGNVLSFLRPNLQVFIFG